ncbi:cation:proton antiporter [Caldinitratiruptor microaerophilus]|uniref:Sodium:proton antiporter n=1 Tax=Caldinitratiruptor microaerophilus TaxID=671077 RepID=A0AA35CMP8_9FIRM|nr:cation:proton antiporter [Caldinitratiruptor microaerophilus]BDG61223.1 sodium:proton antiporter [Caldinitratiruptor microaerophilus]
MKPFLQVAVVLAVIITVAKAAGALSKRLGQPAVFGELLIGLLMGPTLFNLLEWPIFTEGEYLHRLVKDLAELGVIFLMFLAGLETDLGEMRKVGAAALVGATGGVLLPLLAGTGISLAYGYPGYESVFIGTILTATSVSISAQTLLELGQLRSREGTTILGAAVIDDVMGIIVLSLVVALHGAAAGGEAGKPIWLILLLMVLFFAGAIAVGKWIVPPLLRWARNWPGTEPRFALAIVLGLLFAVAAEEFGQVAAITGSYTLGVMMTLDHDLKHEVEEKLSVLAYGFFVPIFFVSIGLEANLPQAIAQSGVGFMTWIVLASILTKIIGAGAGVRPFGFDWSESMRVGIGMVSRGEVALIVAGIGLESGVISQPIYSVMVVMTLVTTLITPILLRFAFRGGGSSLPRVTEA